MTSVYTNYTEYNVSLQPSSLFSWSYKTHLFISKKDHLFLWKQHAPALENKARRKQFVLSSELNTSCNDIFYRKLFPWRS